MSKKDDNKLQKQMYKSIKDKDQKNFMKFFQQRKNTNYTDKNGYTLLMSAVLYQNTDIFEVLLKNGANIHIKDQKGQTALFYIQYVESIEKQIEFLKIMERHFVNYSQKNDKEETIVDILKKKNHQQLADIIQKKIDETKNMNQKKTVNDNNENFELEMPKVGMWKRPIYGITNRLSPVPTS